ncbi:MAG: tRNA (N6-threonylcarbamoyladenosine(37)-N6)-methyltransferase TrmO [Elsteraceae bacterium]
MVTGNDLRVGEMAVPAEAMPPATDAGLYFIGRIRTPWTTRLDCPRQGRQDGPICRLELFEPWAAALEGIEEFAELEVLYWLHESRRDILKQSPKNTGAVRGAFSLRTPVRPNPIGVQRVALVGLEGGAVLVRGLDCVDGTPLIDLKPDRCHFTPLAPKPAGDERIGDG